MDLGFSTYENNGLSFSFRKIFSIANLKMLSSALKLLAPVAAYFPPIGTMIAGVILSATKLGDDAIAKYEAAKAAVTSAEDAVKLAANYVADTKALKDKADSALTAYGNTVIGTNMTAAKLLLPEWRNSVAYELMGAKVTANMNTLKNDASIAATRYTGALSEYDRAKTLFDVKQADFTRAENELEAAENKMNEAKAQGDKFVSDNQVAPTPNNPVPAPAEPAPVQAGMSWILVALLAAVGISVVTSKKGKARRK